MFDAPDTTEMLRYVEERMREILHPSSVEPETATELSAEWVDERH